MAIEKGPFEEGDLVGGIEIEALLGTGGFGFVYRGKDPKGTPVAVKILRTEAQDDADLSARLMKEANLLAEIDHPNVVGFHAAGKDGPTIWLAMEYVPGGTLRDKLPKGKPIDVEQALRWARHVAEGCAEVHKIRDVIGRPVVHRDLKPENVLISRDGMAKVTDFGIAKFRTSLKSTNSNERMGTPCYMAPEQMDGAVDLDERTDVFALGVILYEMLAGKRPVEVGHDGELTLMEMVTRTCTRPVVPLRELNADVPEHVWELVRQSLEKQRELRFASMRLFADALAAALKRVRKERGKRPSFPAANLPEVALPSEVEATGASRETETGGGSTLRSALGNAPTERAPLGGAPVLRESNAPETLTLTPTSRSSGLPAARRHLSPSLAVAGIVLGAAIGVLGYVYWALPNAVPQASSLAGIEVSATAAPLPISSMPMAPSSGSTQTAPPPPSASGSAGVAAVVVKPVRVESSAKAATPKPPQTAKPAAPPAKCAGIVCTPDF